MWGYRSKKIKDWEWGRCGEKGQKIALAESSRLTLPNTSHLITTSSRKHFSLQSVKSMKDLKEATWGSSDIMFQGNTSKDISLIQGEIKTKTFSCLVNALQCSLGSMTKLPRWLTWTTWKIQEQLFCLKMNKVHYKSSLIPEHCQDIEEMKEVCILKYQGLGRSLHLLCFVYLPE